MKFQTGRKAKTINSNPVELSAYFNMKDGEFQVYRRGEAGLLCKANRITVRAIDNLQMIVGEDKDGTRFYSVPGQYEQNTELDVFRKSEGEPSQLFMSGTWAKIKSQKSNLYRAELIFGQVIESDNGDLSGQTIVITLKGTALNGFYKGMREAGEDDNAIVFAKGDLVKGEYGDNYTTSVTTAQADDPDQQTQNVCDLVEYLTAIAPPAEAGPDEAGPDEAEPAAPTEPGEPDLSDLP